MDGSNLYYLRARYYDPAIGRFLAQDPLSGWDRRPQTQNPYPYVMNNPVDIRDPYGLCGLCDWAGDNVVDPITDTTSAVVDAFESGYVDVGGTVCLGPWVVDPCVTVGAQFGAGQGFHPYIGGGAGSWGGGAGVNLFPGRKISEGVTCGFQGSIVRPLIGVFGPGMSGEVGLSSISVGWKESRPTFSATPYGGAGPYFGTPGASAVCYYVFPDIF